ncbi:MAG: hypothetical protein V1745_01515 [Patescibacteria group bacterium]
MKTEARKRTWRPHPLYTQDLWHDIAPIGVALVTVAVLAIAFRLAGRDISSAFEHVSIFHLVGTATIIGLVHLMVTHAPTWFLRRRLFALRARRSHLEADILRRKNSQRTLPPSLLRRIRRYQRISRRIAALEAYERTLL